jgi:hypothetical protein
MLAIVPSPCFNQPGTEIKRLISSLRKIDRCAIERLRLRVRSDSAANLALAYEITQMLNNRPT